MFPILEAVRALGPLQYAECRLAAGKKGIVFSCRQHGGGTVVFLHMIRAPCISLPQHALSYPNVVVTHIR